eukprot:gene1589-2224_t
MNVLATGWTQIEGSDPSQGVETDCGGSQGFLTQFVSGVNSLNDCKCQCNTYMESDGTLCNTINYDGYLDECRGYNCDQCSNDDCYLQYKSPDEFSYARSEAFDPPDPYDDAYKTYEDAPAFTTEIDRLPPNASGIRLVCPPKRTAVFELHDDGTYTYQPAPNEYSVSEGDLDLFSYILLNETGGHHEDYRAVQHVYIYIAPVNDPPVAAYGLDYLVFNTNMDIITPNSIYDQDVRRRLTSPYALKAQLVGSDPDGDELTYSILEPAAHGRVTIVEDNWFQYVPDPDFSGLDYFKYVVDDSLGGGHISGQPNHPGLNDTAEVIMQVGGSNELPAVVDSTIQGQEDSSILGQFIREAVGYTTAVRSFFRFRVVLDPSNGTVEVLCDGFEVLDPETCATDCAGMAQSDCLNAHPAAFFRYYPRLDFFGSDEFFFIYDVEELSLAVTPATVSVTIAPVNDAPTATSSDVAAPMTYSTGPNPTSSYAVVTLVGKDIDSANLTALVTVPPAAQGRLYASLDDDGSPSENSALENLPADGSSRVAIPLSAENEAQLYFVAANGARGTWEVPWWVTDGDLESSMGAVVIRVSCSPGYRIYDSESCAPCAEGTRSELFDQQTCTQCEPGTFSLGGFSTCTLCKENSYQDEAGSSECEACPLNSQSSQGETSIQGCLCTVGYYGAAGTTCQECPKEGEWTHCAESNLLWPLPAEGFWVDTSGETAHVSQCFPSNACKGYTETTKDGQGSNEESDAVSIEAVSSGDTSAAHCLACSDAIVVRVAVMMFVFLLPVLVRVYDQSRIFMAIDIGLTHIQVTGMFWRLDMKWPSVSSKILRFFWWHAIPYEELQIECLETGMDAWENYKVWLKLIILTPPTLAVMLATGRGIRVVMGARVPPRLLLRSDEEARLKRVPSSKHVLRSYMHGGLAKFSEEKTWSGLGTWAVHVMLTYSQTLQLFLAIGSVTLFDCLKSDTDGKYHMRAAPHVVCYDYSLSDQWGEMVPWAITGIVAYIVAPVVGMRLLLARVFRGVQRGTPEDAWLVELCSHLFCETRKAMGLQKLQRYEHFLQIQFMVFRIVILLLTLHSSALFAGSDKQTVLFQAIFCMAVLVILIHINLSKRPYYSLALNSCRILFFYMELAALWMGIVYLSEMRVTNTTMVEQESSKAGGATTAEDTNKWQLVGKRVLRGIHIIKRLQSNVMRHVGAHRAKQGVTAEGEAITALHKWMGIADWLVTAHGKDVDKTYIKALGQIMEPEDLERLQMAVTSGNIRLEQVVKIFSHIFLFDEASREVHATQDHLQPFYQYLKPKRRTEQMATLMWEQQQDGNMKERSILHNHIFCCSKADGHEVNGPELVLERLSPPTPEERGKWRWNEAVKKLMEWDSVRTMESEYGHELRVRWCEDAAIIIQRRFREMM